MKVAYYYIILANQYILLFSGIFELESALVLLVIQASKDPFLFECSAHAAQIRSTSSREAEQVSFFFYDSLPVFEIHFIRVMSLQPLLLNQSEETGLLLTILA